MKLAFISGPYRADTIAGVVRNIRNAEAVAIEYWQKGYAVICPHKNSSLLDGLADDSVWLEGDLEILSRCDLIVLVPGWEKSEGVKAEIEEAKKLGIPIEYCDLDTKPYLEV